jgi:DNA invertase Pin-like site-specific DNA recombinase
LSAKSCSRGSARASSERSGKAKYKGRAPTARAKAADIVKLAGEGVKREDIAARLGVGVASVYRVLAERKAAALAKRAARIGASSR